MFSVLTFGNEHKTARAAEADVNVNIVASVESPL